MNLSEVPFTEDVVLNKIYTIRNQKVMLDSPDSYWDGRTLSGRYQKIK